MTPSLPGPSDSSQESTAKGKDGTLCLRLVANDGDSHLAGCLLAASHSPDEASCCPVSRPEERSRWSGTEGDSQSTSRQGARSLEVGPGQAEISDACRPGRCPDYLCGDPEPGDPAEPCLEFWPQRNSGMIHVCPFSHCILE